MVISVLNLKKTINHLFSKTILSKLQYVCIIFFTYFTIFSHCRKIFVSKSHKICISETGDYFYQKIQNIFFQFIFQV